MHDTAPPGGFQGQDGEPTQPVSEAELAFFAGDPPTREVSGESTAHDVGHELREVRAEPRLDLVAKYLAFDQTFGPIAGLVYHPGCANDCSPSEVFAREGNHVVYADIDEESVKVLRKAGYDAVAGDANEFNPGPVDLLILLNPSIGSKGPSAHVRPGGYALANDYHGNATELFKSKEYEVVGIVHDRTEDGLAREYPLTSRNEFMKLVI